MSSYTFPLGGIQVVPGAWSSSRGKMYSAFVSDLLAKKGLNKHCSVSKVCIETFKLIECVSE